MKRQQAWQVGDEPDLRLVGLALCVASAAVTIVVVWLFLVWLFTL